MTAHWTLLGSALLLLTAGHAMAQVRVHPTGVNVNASGATVVFLTYGGLTNYEPAEAFWCGELIDAFPDVGTKCDPSTLFGGLPLRSNLTSPTGTGGLTDIMSIPPSVARRAYQAAEAGADSRFFYVRRFVSMVGAPDVYVPVTCRLTGGGARVPFALLDVRLAFEDDKEVLAVSRGEEPPPLYAEIAYNGTGQLRGRWEIVRPGEEAPATRDLLTEAALPIEERALQRRYTELNRFTHFLPPSTRRFRLDGPDPEFLPSDAEGLYMVLLRVEATDDKEGDSDLAAVGAGSGVVHSGAVAGFPIPPLRYYVGVGGRASHAPIAGKLYHILPEEDARLGAGNPVDFSWTEVSQAIYYRLDVKNAGHETVLSALMPVSMAAYRAPEWIYERAPDGTLFWCVNALGADGREIMRTDWRRLSLPSAEMPPNKTP